jgi:RNA polymerase sigma factor (TIGR02999 family)
MSDDTGTAELPEFAELLDELRKLAHAARRRIRSGDTLATTALVNEAYLKLARPSSAKAVDRAHFFGLAAKAMREILIDEARRRAGAGYQALARAQALPEIERADEWVAPALDPLELVALDQAMQRLTAIQPRLAEVVTCRFFAGYTEAETAEIVGVDVRTVQRDWQRARAWLAELRRHD